MASISIGLLILPEIGSVRDQCEVLSFIPSGAASAPAAIEPESNLLNLLKEIDHGRTDELARRGPGRLQGTRRCRGLPGALLAGDHAEGTGQDPRLADQRLRLLPGHARDRRAQAWRKRPPPEPAAGVAGSKLVHPARARRAGVDRGADAAAAKPGAGCRLPGPARAVFGEGDG
ncbi:hypothetical protein CBM2605_A60618 [Cupriavidus neocaledonicus]|uniref:Uncharacterized protein n=1 Tax=Cupriavidus neocaledonicus TaxID=1040979 RepID=A0ABY1V3Q9_9BURK|nr:hypothetical protein CBM2605_A60618 [Cupriavidus neocaledonicus]